MIARGNAAAAALGSSQRPEDVKEAEAFDLLKGIRDMLSASGELLTSALRAAAVVAGWQEGGRARWRRR